MVPDPPAPPPADPPAAPPGAPAGVGPTDPERAALERLKAVKDFFILVRKGVKNMGMYAHDPKRFPTFIKPAANALGPLLAGGLVPLNVEAESFTFQKESVWSIEGGENVPGRFFREGIRQLVLRPGMTEEELNKLIAIMLSNPDRGGEEILSQLFNASFQHVSYAVAELFAFGDLSEGQVSLEVRKLIEELEKRHATATPEVVAQAQAMAQGLDKKLAAMERPQAPYVKDGEVAASYRERVQQDLAKDDGERLHRHLVSFVLGQLKDGSLRDPAQAADVLAQLLDGMLQRGDLKPLGNLLATLDGIKEGYVPVAEIRSTLGGRMSEEPRLRQLGVVLNGADPDWMAAARYLAECKPGAAPVLLDVLSVLEGPAAQSLVLEAVAALDKDAGQYLSERLEVDGAKSVAHLVTLAERLPPLERGKLVQQAINHPTTEIRVEAVKALLRSAAPEQMHRFALEATTDRDPAVRAAAFRAMVKLSPRRAALDLIRLPKLPDWEKRSQTERELVYECLGSTEADEAFRYLLGLLQVPKKGLFGAKRVEQKLLAIRGLQHMNTLQAFKTLQNIPAMPDQDPEAVAAGQKAVLRLRQSMLAAEKAQQAGPAPGALSPEVLAAVEFVRKSFAARQPPAVTAPSAPGMPQTSPLFGGPAAQPAAAAAPATSVLGTDLDSLDDLFGPSDPKGPAPTWATPGPKGGTK